MPPSKNMMLAGAAATAATAYYLLGNDGDESTLTPVKGRKRTVFITGAAAGIGKATAMLFLKQDWFVGAFDIDENALNEVYGNLEQEGKVITGFVDVCDSKSCDEAIQKFLKHSPGGKLDVLFNNAGILRIGKFDEMDLANQTKQIRVNCDGICNVAFAAIDALKDSKGRIVNMSSVSSGAGIPLHAVYAATKAFVRSITESWRSEFAAFGIRVCDVAPPYVSTAMTSSQDHKGGLFDEKEKFLTPEVVAACVWKAANECSYYNEHFYTDFMTKATFKLIDFSRLFGLRIHTDEVDKSIGISSSRL